MIPRFSMWTGSFASYTYATTLIDCSEKQTNKGGERDAQERVIDNTDASRYVNPAAVGGGAADR
jgi:hypothetical protein